MCRNFVNIWLGKWTVNTIWQWFIWVYIQTVTLQKHRSVRLNTADYSHSEETQLLCGLLYWLWHLCMDYYTDWGISAPLYSFAVVNIIRGWVSEQFLNGTSAKYRLYSAIQIKSWRKITIARHVLLCCSMEAMWSVCWEPFNTTTWCLGCTMRTHVPRRLSQTLADVNPHLSLLPIEIRYSTELNKLS